MSLQSLKISLIQEVLNADDEFILKDVATFFSKSKDHQLKPLTKDALIKETEIALKDIEEGRVVEVSQLKEDIKKWG